MSEKQGGKRKAEGGSGGGGGKKSKGKYFQSTGKPGGIPLNSRGVLVSCVSGKEHQAARETISLLTEAHEALRPGSTKPVAPAAAADVGDISALIASEVAELKDVSKQAFYYHNTGVNSVVYVEFKDPALPSPCDLVVAACRAAKESGQSKSRFINRFYPLEEACFASVEKIGELAAKVVERHFGEGAEPTQFAVQYDHRAAPPMDRMEIINLFAQKIQAPHKVNLNNATKTILVNLLKNACGVAVVEQYKELAKFNIRTLTAPPDAEAKAGGGEGGKRGAGAGEQTAGAGQEGAQPSQQADAAKEQEGGGKEEPPQQQGEEVEEPQG